ncbi:MAG: N-acetylmuramoyl-L-alanine amidase [Chlamydiia bacterium]
MKIRTLFSLMMYLISLYCVCTTPLFGELIHSSEGLRSKEFQTPSSPAGNKPTIMLDAGHGGKDEGTKVNAFKEKKITLATALYAKRYLEQMGYRVILTRAKDVEMSLSRRVALANKTRSAIFVSIHFNASKNTEAKGVEIFYYDAKDPERTKNSRKLANYILHQVIDQTEAASRGVKMGNFHVIRETQVPAVLLEGGFVTNGPECAHLRKKEYLENIAKGLALGIDRYFRS